MKRNLLLLITAGICFSAFAQPSIQWQKCFGGTNGDYTGGLQPTLDGGYITIGNTYSSNGNVSGYSGNGDLWVIKIDRSGTLQWQKCLGGSDYEDAAYPIPTANCIKQTSDGGYIVAGLTYSMDGIVSGNHGDADAWLAKLDAGGNVQWQRCLGGSYDDYANAVIETFDGGFTIAGYTGSNDSDVAGNHGRYDMWLVHLNTTGELQWQKCLGGSDDDFGNAITQVNDGGYVVAGQTWSVDGDVDGNRGLSDEWIVKCDATGTLQWQKCLGGSGDENAVSILRAAGGGYIVAGYTDSNDGDVSNSFSNTDCWIVKLDNAGKLEWENCYGGPQSEYCYSLSKTNDGGYILSRQNYGNGGQVSGHHGSVFNSDYWIVKTDSIGALQWQLSLGGGANEFAVSANQCPDGGFIISGGSSSVNDDVTGNHGSYDAWIVKLSFSVNSEQTLSSMNTILISPNPASNVFSVSLNNEQANSVLTIYDKTGRTVHEQIINRKEENVHTDLPQGIYLVKVKEGNKVFAQKLVIE